jgi:cytochrome c-type biogenesis protein CcmH/NrfG
VYARLDQIRGPEDAAADLIDLWGAVESAMRAMLGGSVLSGQALVRELRQRGLLNLDQANSLASFWDARSRVDSVNYKPTLTDVGYARAGYNQLTEAVEATPTVQPTATPPAAITQADAAHPPAPSIEMPVFERKKAERGSLPLLVTVGVLVVVVLVAVGYLLFGRSSYDKEMNAAIASMQSGQIETARAEFIKVTHDYPTRAEPHVFLARLARTDGDLQTAHLELETAIRADPANGQAMREMGLLLLAENNPALAVNFFIRAIKADTSDPAAKGYLGCALIKQNRIDEGEKFLARAGSGSWTSCKPGVPPGIQPTPAP